MALDTRSPPAQLLLLLQILILPQLLLFASLCLGASVHGDLSGGGITLQLQLQQHHQRQVPQQLLSVSTSGGASGDNNINEKRQQQQQQQQQQHIDRNEISSDPSQSADTPKAVPLPQPAQWQFWGLDLVSREETLARRYPFLFGTTTGGTTTGDTTTGDTTTGGNGSVMSDDEARRNRTMINVRDYYDNSRTIESPLDYLKESSAETLQYDYEKSIEFTSRFTRDYSLYSDLTELQLSGAPHKNNTKCLQQLQWLHQQLIKPEAVIMNNSAYTSDISARKGPNSINLARYLDSFGRPEAASYLGNNYWYGSYEECLSLKFNLSLEKDQQQQQQQSTAADSHLFANRYCLGKLESRYWPQNDNFAPRPSIKIGLCVPQSCDTQMFSGNFHMKTQAGGSEHLLTRQLITDIMMVNFAPKFKNTYKLADVYCLPDPESPIRKLPLSAYVLIVACASWCLMVTVASLWHLYRCRQRSYYKQDALIDYIIMQQQQQHQQTDGELSCATNGALNNKQLSTRLHSMLITSVTTNNDDHSKQVAPTGDINNECPASTPLVARQVPVEEANATNQLTSGDINNYLNHHMKQTHSGSKSLLDTILNILSVSTSLDHLKSVPQLSGQSRVDLIPLSFLKVLCTLAIVGGHTAHWNGLSSKSSKVVLDYLTEHWVQITLVFAYAVDTFYVMAGVLFGYFTMKKLYDKQMPACTLLKFKSWLGINGLVWFRLSTIYIPVYWFSYSLAVYLGSGPMWDYGTNENSFRGTCIKQTRWYHFILYSASLGRDHTEPPCNEPAWFIETYVRIFLVLPPLTYLLIKYPKWSIIIVGMVVSATSFVTGLLAYNQTAVTSSYALKYALSSGAIEAKYSGYSYFNSFTYRLAPVLIGTLGGIYLYKFDVGTLKAWPRWMRGPVSLKLILFGHLLVAIETLTAKLVVDSMMTGGEGGDHLNEWSLRWNNVISTAKLQPIWCFLNLLLILRLTTSAASGIKQTHNLMTTKSNNNCKTVDDDDDDVDDNDSDCVDCITTTCNVVGSADHCSNEHYHHNRSHCYTSTCNNATTSCSTLIGSSLMRLMRHRYWIILSRLTFCIYLIHCEIIYFILSHNYQSRANVDVFRTFRDFFFTIIMSYIVATIVYLMYEAPMDKLVKTIVGRLPNGRKLSIQSHNNNSNHNNHSNHNKLKLSQPRLTATP